MSTTVETPTAEIVVTPGETPEEPFDRDRAMATITKLREYESEAKRLKVELDKRDKTERDAADKRLAEQNEFRTLAEQRADRIVELEAQTGQVATLTAERDAALAVVKDLVSGELDAAPDYVRDAIAERGPVDQLRYLNQHRDKWATDDTRRGTREMKRGNGTTNLTRDQMVEREIQAQRAGRVRIP